MATTDDALLVPHDETSYNLMNGFALIVMYGTAFVGLKELAVAQFQHCTPLVQPQLEQASPTPVEPRNLIR